MISISTPHKQIVSELTEEEQKAFFWLRKKYHGDKGYEAMRDKLLFQCRQSKKTQISDIVEYISPKGNRWMVFECCQYYKEAGSVNTMPVAFCYYETYGSVGAFIVGRNMYDFKNDDKCVIHFTNHFFLRFCQRLGVEMRSRWMVQRFCEVITGYMFGSNGVDEQGRLKVDVRLPASIGRGVMLKDAPIIEVRTYLTDRELNNKQLRETKKLREVYDNHIFEPYEVKRERLAHSKDFANDVLHEIKQVSSMSGVSSKKLEFGVSMRILLTEVIIDMGYVEQSDTDAFKRIGEQTAEVDFLDAADKFFAHADGVKIAKAIFDDLCKFGELSQIKGFDAKAVMDKLIEKWTKRAKKA